LIKPNPKIFEIMIFATEQQVPWMLSEAVGFVFDVLKSAIGPFVGFLILAYVHEPYRVSRQKFESYFSWLNVLPSEITRIKAEVSGLLYVLRTLNFQSHVMTAISPEFLIAARIPMMSHPRARHVIPAINDVVVELTEALQHITRYNEALAPLTSSMVKGPLSTNSTLGLDRVSKALDKLQAIVSDELALTPSFKPRLLRFWFQADLD